ncbi:hypothetical protein TNIN_443231 [Trichonephila inaurata madagascariensis]|uniref:Uncharacterized protein n=1 Tax=Trichonephila inaurata madagascariensis TaxID=2747483 RepID=A0A8X6XF43_9ARAC|nr:hypothetical protein TNIN_443231 [Trichonephila inaurata madagascariensis]
MNLLSNAAEKLTQHCTIQFHEGVRLRVCDSVSGWNYFQNPSIHPTPNRGNKWDGDWFFPQHSRNKSVLPDELLSRCRHAMLGMKKGFSTILSNILELLEFRNKIESS